MGRSFPRQLTTPASTVLAAAAKMISFSLDELYVDFSGEDWSLHLSPDLLQGLDLSVYPSQLQAWRLRTFGVVRMSWKCGKVRSRPDGDKNSCGIWCQNGC